MKRQTPMWLLASLMWLVVSVVVAGLVFYVSSLKTKSAVQIDWLFVVLLSTAVTGIVIALIREFRARPSPIQQAALNAIFNAEDPNVIGAVVVVKNGTPEVVTTIRSRAEYLELAGSGRLPEEHLVFLPDDA